MCLGAMGALQAQEPLSQDEALKQIYSQYDAAKHTAHWVCTKEQEKDGMHTGWPCDKDNETVYVSVELTAEVQEGSAKKTYFAISAKPINPETGDYSGAGYNCHGCSVAVGAGVFTWKGQQWVLESASAAVGFYGEWGHPPGIELVQVGPEKHGLLLSVNDEAQGFAGSNKILLLPINRTVAEVWFIEDENDNLGRIDPNDKSNHEVPYKSSATFKFFAANDGVSREYYDIEVISRGKDREDFGHPIKPENWTEIYRFKDGKYKLLSHKDFIEVKKPAKK
jgi:hypothetical protein